MGGEDRSGAQVTAAALAGAAAVAAVVAVAVALARAFRWLGMLDDETH